MSPATTDPSRDAIPISAGRDHRQRCRLGHRNVAQTDAGHGGFEAAWAERASDAKLPIGGENAKVRDVDEAVVVEVAARPRALVCQAVASAPRSVTSTWPSRFASPPYVNLTTTAELSTATPP